jgi:hypothetical protein
MDERPYLTTKEEAMRKKSILWLSVALLMVGLWGLNHRTNAQLAEVVWDIYPDANSFSFVDIDTSGDPTPGEPFVVGGPIFRQGETPEANTPIGRFWCRGFFIAPEEDGDITIVHQSFEVNGAGTIHIEGTEPGNVPGVDGARRAIVGGTARFATARGEAVIEPLPPEGGLNFRITFKLF